MHNTYNKGAESVFFPRNRTIIAPIQHEGTGHWVLLVLKMQQMRLFIYDTLNLPDKERYIVIPFKEWMGRQHEMEQGCAWEYSDDITYVKDFNTGKGMTPQEISKSYEKNNCGIFTCMFMLYLCQRKPFNLRPSDDTKIRAWILHRLKSPLLMLPDDHQPH
jgi:Ulp1 family protease